LIELLNRLYTEIYGKYVEFKEDGMRLQDIIMTRSEEVEARMRDEMEAREAEMEAEMEAMKAEMEAKMEELAQTYSEERVQVVLNMKKIGLSAEQIAQVSGFSVKEVEDL
jgi:DNA-directed RNA polymerase specialized sigma24 family protein